MNRCLIKCQLLAYNRFGNASRRYMAALPNRGGGGSQDKGGKVIGRKDTTEERKFLDAMQQLAFASDKAAK